MLIQIGKSENNQTRYLKTTPNINYIVVLHWHGEHFLTTFNSLKKI